MFALYPLQTAEWFLRLALAQALTILILGLNIVSFSLPYSGEIKPFLMLIAIYYWSVYRPTLLPVWLAFSYGLILDLLAGFPVGVNAIIFVLVRWIITDQRLYLTGQSFLMSWYAFGATALGAGILQWLIFSAAALRFLPFSSGLASLLLSIFLFPFFSIILHGVHKLLPVRPHDFTAPGKSL